MKVVLHLLLLLGLMPFNFIYILIISLIPVEKKKYNKKSVLITGGKMSKSLLLCRHFSNCGYRVHLAESRKYRYSGARYSKAIYKFHIIPNHFDTPKNFKNSLKKIIKDENIDFFIPVTSPQTSVLEAEVGDDCKNICTVIQGQPEQVKLLDDKLTFNNKLIELKYNTLITNKVENISQIIETLHINPKKQFILKPLIYSSEFRAKIKPFNINNFNTSDISLIDFNNDWIIQEYIDGSEFCTHSVFHNGQMTLHVCSTSSSFCLNYEAVEFKEIEKIVKNIGSHFSFTGQISFDLIEDKNGKIYFIECNPRAHSAISLFSNSNELVNAYTNKLIRKVVSPLPQNNKTYWLYHEFFSLIASLDFVNFIKVIFNGREAIFNFRDPLPFFFFNHLQIMHLLFLNLINRKKFYKIDFNIGKLIEADGD